ncbi:MAG: hypothetical protein LJE58_09870 [Thiogranum sp.]|jgi:phosphotransferase system enzyme I (PtsI)|nr:hypothetical protein [Thiogranum sp.]
MVAEKRRLPAETRLKGVALAPGVALGRACFYTRRSAEPDTTVPAAAPQESQRLNDALNWLARERSVLARQAAARLGPEHAEIFEAHRLMLSDECLRSRLLRSIEDNARSAEAAVEMELSDYREQLAGSGSEYLQQRVADINEIQQGLLAYLRHTTACRHCTEAANCSIGHCPLGNDHILVSEEITASLPIETDRHTTGFIVTNSGPDSHAVILARALHRPVVGDIHDLPAAIPADARILLDGDSGDVILNPTRETLAHYQGALAGHGHKVQMSGPVPGLTVMANIGQSGDVGDALAAGAEGVGLYRTEMEMLVAGRLLGEHEQAARYSEVAKAMGGRPVCIRLLDLGSDKTADWLTDTLGDQTAARQRGARLLLEHPELLRTQARALARASLAGPVQVLYPMIVSLDQFLELRALFDQAVSDLPASRLQHGVLFEVPGACLTAGRIMQAADFGCIGTNDLIQYLFADDRSHSAAHNHAGFETDTVLWELMETLSRAAARADKPMSICGEVAGNPDFTGRIMQAGIRAISASPTRIAGVRQAARQHGATTPKARS